jgi:hypothetical protein
VDDRELIMETLIWVAQLNVMYQRHAVTLDHKDCKDIADILTNLKDRLQQAMGASKS